MSLLLQIEEFIIDIFRTYFISIYTYYMSLKLINYETKTKQKKSFIFISIFLIVLISQAMKLKFGFVYSILLMSILLSFLFVKFTNNSYSYSTIVTVISLSINYVLFSASIFFSYILHIIINIQNNYINLIILLMIYTIIVNCFLKVKRLKNGLTFLQGRVKDEYFNWIIINISVIILFLIIVLSNYQIKITGKLGIGLIIFSSIMFITIQKSLQLYYKQKLLIQDLEETKKELEDKKLEIEKLEKENLNFSKVSHSIAHKQKSLEHKLNELMLKNETASEIDIRDRINAISKEMQPRQAKELSKTDIIEIDDMLKYMQAECINDKIEFELQISGNIYQMINNHIVKEDLEILLADHIKNAIIAINHSDNSNKSILVRLGIIDGCYSLYIYDSGIEFEIDTLEKLGKVPSTTHKESGGTGMGFMNTFDTLKKYNASMIINEYGKPSKDNYTKVLMIKFDKKNEFKIKSYRSEEIENKCNLEDINVEKLIINKN